MIKSLKDLLDKFSRFTNSLVYDGGICKRLNRLNKDMTKHKIKRVSKYFLSNQLDKLEIKRNSIYHINYQE